MVLIGLIGKMGSGKDYIAYNYIIPYIEKELNRKAMTFCFADQLKVNVMTKYKIGYKDLYVKKSSDTRSLLQIEGTENGRNVYGKEYWLQYFSNWIDVFSNRGCQDFVVTDVRFKNEFDYIKKKNGIIIKIVAPNRNYKRLLEESKGDLKVLETINTHDSERNLDDICDDECDCIVLNDFKEIKLDGMYKAIRGAINS